MDKKYLDILKKLVEKASKNQEIPVGAIILYKSKIIAKAYNRRNKTNNVLMHAEIDALKKASKKLKTWKLVDCEMIVSLKPCTMCTEVIKEARIKNVYYLLNNEKVVNKKTKFIKIDVEEDRFYKQLISNFFKKKR